MSESYAPQPARSAVAEICSLVGWPTREQCPGFLIEWRSASRGLAGRHEHAVDTIAGELLTDAMTDDEAVAAFLALLPPPALGDGTPSSLGSLDLTCDRRARLFDMLRSHAEDAARDPAQRSTCALACAAIHLTAPPLLEVVTCTGLARLRAAATLAPVVRDFVGTCLDGLALDGAGVQLRSAWNRAVQRDAPDGAEGHTACASTRPAPAPNPVAAPSPSPAPSAAPPRSSRVRDPDGRRTVLVSLLLNERHLVGCEDEALRARLCDVAPHLGPWPRTTLQDTVRMMLALPSDDPARRVIELHLAERERQRASRLAAHANARDGRMAASRDGADLDALGTLGR